MIGIEVRYRYVILESFSKLNSFILFSSHGLGSEAPRVAHNLLRVARVIYLIPRANSLVTLSSSNALSLTWPPTARLTMVPPTLLTFDSNSRRASRYPWGRSIWGPMRPLAASAISSTNILKALAA